MEETLKLYKNVLKEVEKIHPNIQRSAQRKITLSLVDVINEKKVVEKLLKNNNQGSD